MPHGRHYTACEQACTGIGTMWYQPLRPEACLSLSITFNPSLACLVRHREGHRVWGS